MHKQKLSLIGFGEAGEAFVGKMDAEVVAYDRKTDVMATRGGKLADGTRFGVALAQSNREAVATASLILSLVTAGQALAAASETAAHIAPGAVYCDMNSVGPDTKRAAATVIEAAGGRYVDVAILAPVHPAGLKAPLLASGAHADIGASALRGIGFRNVRPLTGDVGAASAVKMIRSVMIKGMEALSAECALAAEVAGVREEVIASLDASWTSAGWASRFDYNLDRALLHGLRRAAEMDEVVGTLEALGVDAAMSRATAGRQRALGGLRLVPPESLEAKLQAILPLISPPEQEDAAWP